ncbi:MAG: DUF1963 domain-containing protein [Chitinophagaceae bacterium]
MRKLFGGGNKSGDNQHLLEKVPVAQDLQLPRVLEAYREDIIKARLPFAKIQAVPGDTLSIMQSSFGYYPAIPKDFIYPLDSEGNYLFPLAQIRFSEVPALPGYPSSGFLQFYISGIQDNYGLNIKDRRSQKDFRIHFFEEEELTDPVTDFSFLQLDDRARYNVPIDVPHALSFSLQHEYMGRMDLRFAKEWAFYSAFSQQHPEIRLQLESELREMFKASGHKIGGYATFRQWDPRDEKDDTNDYVLLLQIDTDDRIMWGDSGIGSFFIHPADLQKKDFSRVLYHWDSH